MRHAHPHLRVRRMVASLLSTIGRSEKLMLKGKSSTFVARDLSNEDSGLSQNSHIRPTMRPIFVSPHSSWRGHFLATAPECPAYYCCGNLDSLAFWGNLERATVISGSSRKPRRATERMETSLDNILTAIISSAILVHVAEELPQQCHHDWEPRRIDPIQLDLGGMDPVQ